MNGVGLLARRNLILDLGMSIDSSSLSSVIRSDGYPKRYAGFVAVAGWALIGSGLSSILFSSLPLELLQPEFQLRLMGAILAAANFLLLGALFVCGARLLNGQDQRLVDRARFMQKCCRWFAIVLLLIVPLQLLAGMAAISKVQTTESEMLKQRRQVIYGFSRTSSEQELRSYVASLPDRPQLPAEFDAPFPVIKKRALDNLSQGYKNAEADLRSVRSKRLENFLGQFFRNSVQALLMAFAFWAMRSTTRQKMIP